MPDLKHAFRAMGTDVVLIVPEESASANATIDPKRLFREVETRIGEYERHMSRFLEDSDISRVNGSPGEWVVVSRATAEVVAEGIRWMKETNGLFDFTLGGRLKRIGYDASFEVVKSRPSTMEGDAETHPSQGPPMDAAATSGSEGVSLPIDVCLDPPKVRIQPGRELDLGGIAKGWIVEHTAQYMRDAGCFNFVLSAGGDMVCAGTRGSHPWRVGIADPVDPSRAILRVEVRSAAFATSGTYNRRWRQGPTEVHHLLDPRTGHSSASDVASCSVGHPSLCSAEVLAKTGLLMGSTEGSEWLRSRSDVLGFVMVKVDGTVVDGWGARH